MRFMILVKGNAVSEAGAPVSAVASSPTAVRP